MNKKITFMEAMLTAVGMVIGSGIFFRADNILSFTEGNVSVAILAWFVLGCTLIFAGIGVSVLAARSDKEGGIIGYMEDIYGKTAAFIVGWFTSVIYIPLLTGILAIVATDYLLQFLNVESTAVLMQAVAAVLILLAYTWNYLSTKFSALFSSAATVIKMLPIIIVGFMGLARADFEVVTSGFASFEMGLFVAPLLSMAFAFDGWTSVATLSRDMENPQKDIAKVLALNAVIVTLAYVFYFTGVCMILPAQEIIQLENAHVDKVASIVLGDFGGKFVTFCVFISCMGTLNGNVMAGFRYPHALAQAKDLPNSDYFVQESKYGTTGRAAMFSLVIVAFWFVLYTVQAVAAEAAAKSAATEHLFSGITFDDIPIMGIALVISLLLVGTMKIGMKEGNGVVKSIIAPVIGIVGQLYVVYSFISTNDEWLMYSAICIVILVVGYFIRSSVKKNQA